MATKLTLSKNLVSLTIFAAIVAACAVQTEPTESTGSATQAYSEYNVGFYNPFLNKCLDAYAWETTEYPRVAMWTCNGLSNQYWTYNTVTHEIRDWNDNCLENWVWDNTRVGLHACWGGANQKWTIDSARHQVVNDWDGKCLRSVWETNVPCGGTRCLSTPLFLAGCNDAEWDRYSVFITQAHD